MESRISAARERASRANNLLLGSAAALFVAALVAARVAHPAHASHATSTSSSSDSSSTATASPSTDGYYDDSGDDGYGSYGGDYYGSGSTAPSQSSVPQLSTGGS